MYTHEQANPQLSTAFGVLYRTTHSTHTQRVTRTHARACMHTHSQAQGNTDSRAVNRQLTVLFSEVKAEYSSCICQEAGRNKGEQHVHVDTHPYAYGCVHAHTDTHMPGK